MSKKGNAAQSAPMINPRQHFATPADAITGLELYAANMAAPGIVSRFSYEQTARFMKAVFQVEAQALEMADPETSDTLAALDRELGELLEAIRAVPDYQPDNQLTHAFTNKAKKRVAVITLNHALKERAAVVALLAEEAERLGGHSQFAQLFAAIAEGAEAALFDDSIPGQEASHG